MKKLRIVLATDNETESEICARFVGVTNAPAIVWYASEGDKITRSIASAKAMAARIATQLGVIALPLGSNFGNCTYRANYCVPLWHFLREMWSINELDEVIIVIPYEARLILSTSIHSFMDKEFVGKIFVDDSKPGELAVIDLQKYSTMGIYLAERITQRQMIEALPAQTVWEEKEIRKIKRKGTFSRFMKKREKNAA